LARPESAREREPRERGPGLRVPVCACAVIALAGVPLLASSDQRNGHLWAGVARVLGPTQKKIGVNARVLWANALFG